MNLRVATFAAILGLCATFVLYFYWTLSKCLARL